MSYDMKYHPMDDTLRPHQSAVRKAAHGLDVRSPTTTSESTISLADESDETASIESPKSPSKTSNPVHLVRTSPARPVVRPRIGSPSSRRVTRAEVHGEKEVDYDMKHHPMDEVLRPRQSASRKAAHAADAGSVTKTTGFSELLIDESHDEVTLGMLNSSLKTSLRVFVAGAGPVLRPERLRSDSPSRQRVTREKNREKLVGYNMKHHPMDSLLRPVQARKRLEKWSTVTDGSLPTIDPKKNVVKVLKQAKQSEVEVRGQGQVSLPCSTTEEQPLTTPSRNQYIPTALAPLVTDPATIDHRRSLVSQQGIGWKSLNSDDRLIYLLQKGAPLSGKHLPINWPAAAGALRIDQAAEKLEAIKNRYEMVRRGLQKFFGAEAEPTEPADMTIRYAEDFDVYDYEIGDKYWHHSIDSIVKPTHLTTISPVARQQAPVISKETPRDGVEPGSDTSTVLGDKVAEPPHKDRDHIKSNSKRQEKSENEGNDDRITVGFVPVDDADVTEDDYEGRGLNASYNDADGYLRQAVGLYEDSDESTIDEGPESEIVATMRNEISANIDDLLEPDELAPMFLSSASAAANDDTGSEEEEEERILQPIPVHRPKKRIVGNRDFSVHVDQPGNTPKIKRQIALNPKSPGTDIPKENLRERSPSDEPLNLPF